MVQPQDLQWLMMATVYLSDMETITVFGDQQIGNILDKIETKQKTFKKAQPAITFSKLTIETPGQGVKHVQKLTIKTTERGQ